MDSYSHDSGTYTGKGGVEIFFQKWVVRKARAVLILVHGIGEHSGRYGNLLKSLSGKNISVFALDHRGHGRSEGKRGHVDSFMDYIYDLKLFTEFVKEENRGLPVILYGHSMGGVIASRYATTYPDDLSMLVLSSPGFTPAMKIPDWKKSLGAFMSTRIPAFSTSTGINANLISHDSGYVKSYLSDPLNHNKASARFFVEFSRATGEALAGAPYFRKPLLVFHGRDDQIVDYKGAEQFYKNASSSVKKLFLYEGLYHETINESPAEAEKVLSDVTGWIVSHIGSLSAVKQQVISAVKKSAAKKGRAKKTAVKKASAKKSAVKKVAAKKPAVKKAAVKKPAVKKGSTKKSAVKRVSVKKAVVKKAASKKTVKKIKK
ncbi:MAG TPA: lysophospholipase [Spirochaetota bacterium]|nr:alpha/beta hydrolase [Spirochaetota bacterium]HQO40223.1 lysophospholipase [Spirochaetota bacterium]